MQSGKCISGNNKLLLYIHKDDVTVNTSTHQSYSDKIFSVGTLLAINFFASFKFGSSFNFIFILFCLFYLPFLSSIHEKANCIAILWTGSPHYSTDLQILT